MQKPRGLADRPENAKGGGTKGVVNMGALGDTNVYFIYFMTILTAHIKRHKIRLKTT